MLLAVEAGDGADGEGCVSVSRLEPQRAQRPVGVRVGEGVDPVAAGAALHGGLGASPGVARVRAAEVERRVHLVGAGGEGALAPHRLAAADLEAPADGLAVLAAV